MTKTNFATKMAQIYRLFKWLILHPLNRGNKLDAISRFIRWQIAARLLPEAIFGLPFVNNSVLLVQRGMTGATGNWYSGLDEVHEMGFIAHVLSDDGLFIDVGANIGSYTILAAAGCSCKVVSFEPSKRTFSVLRRNIKVNNLEHLVETHCLALSNASGSIRFTTNCDTTNHVVPEGKSDTADAGYEIVPVTTLDEILGERYSSSCKVIKLDVEGFELNVLKGATSTLTSENMLAIIVEINGSSSRYSGTDDEIVNFLQSMGYSSFKYDAIGRKVNGVAADQVITSENLIFTRNLHRLEELIRSNSDRKIKVSGGYV